MIANPMRFRSPLLGGLLLILSATTAVVADDGVFEINQACAVDGCFADDPPGFPVSILRPGSYRLTSDLVLDSAGPIMVAIRSSFVHLDLAGFSLRGPVTCTGFPPSCSGIPQGTGSAIDIAPASGGSVRGVTVTGGQVAGAEIHGIEVEACQGCRFSDLILSGNALAGLSASVSEGLMVTGVIARGNGRGGLIAADHSLLVQNLVEGNGSTTAGAALLAGPGSLLRDNIVSGNDSNGIACDGSCVIVGNAVRDNDQNGIETTDSLLRANAIADNGAHGISGKSGASDSLLVDSVLVGNAAFGFRAGSGAAYGRNVFRSNFGSSDENGQVTPEGHQLVPSLCGSTSPCP